MPTSPLGLRDGNENTKMEALAHSRKNQ